MAAYNKVVLLGNLTRDIELKFIGAKNTPLADVGIAVNKRVKKGEEWVDEVSFFDLTMFGRTAEVASEYLGKGSQVLIEGELKQEQWETEGQKRSKVKVIVNNLQMLGSKGEGGGSRGGQQSQGAPQPQATGRNVNGTIADDVPF